MALGENQAVIEVESPGGPIPGDVVERLFEPFFTTKPNGTGLGLATAYNLMVSQGGGVALAGNSETVRFSVLLPRAPLVVSR